MTAAAPPTASSPVVAPQRVLAICCLSVLIVVLDESSINVALPAIQQSLGASVSELQWVVAVYTLVLATLLILAGSAADRFGRRRIFQTGLALFVMGSLLSSAAWSPGALILFRALQGVGGSMLNPVAMSIISNTFADDARQRARALGVWGAVVGIALALGPVVGGLLVDTVGWRSIFYVNVPIGLAAIALTQRFVPESRAERPRSLDPPAQLLLVVGVGTLTYAVIEGPDAGWASAQTVALFAVALACAPVLIAIERRRQQPLIDLRFFRSAPFSGAILIALTAFAALGGFLFLTSLYLQDVRGYSPLGAGLATVPLALGLAVMAPLSGRLVASRGPRTSLLLAGAATTVSTLLLVRLSPDTALGYLLVAYLVFGVGAGFVNAPISNSAVSGLPRDQAGLAASLASSSRQVGASLGVAVTGATVAGSSRLDFTQASHIAWALLAGCGLVIFATGYAVTTDWAARTAQDARALFDDSMGGA